MVKPLIILELDVTITLLVRYIVEKSLSLRLIKAL
ncbi:hypothetical protein TorRG33x02_040980 [Trema orientale]|uniref:Uncharacterized protein n=1 Tax=Trema orientale TaxID=63057 RepID=A0A2P5FR87_TREOI|nr:hypothetical protein TorRG33x02_040980 [Trema orientale]